jgi:hypothetical protein
MAGKIITKLPAAIDFKLRLLTEELRNLGISHIGHGLIVQNNNIPSAFFSTQEWAERYDQEDLISRDPIRACALQTNYHIIPWDSIMMTKEQRVVFNERKRLFEAKTGLLISIKTPQLHETFVLGTDSAKYDVFELFNQNVQYIFNYLLRFRKEHLSFYNENREALIF